MLKLENISKKYGRNEVLRALDFSLEAETLNVLLGSNGAGKSTFLRLLAQLEEPSAGRLWWKQKSLDAEVAGYLPQDVRFHPLLSVDAIMGFYARVWNLPLASASAALVRWGLSAHRKKRTHQLSGGLRQRLGLALLSLRPFAILLLDEPSLSLDVEWRLALRNWISEVVARGTLAIVSTHLAEEWDGVASNWLRCEGGSVIVQEAGDGCPREDAKQGGVTS